MRVEVNFLQYFQHSCILTVTGNMNWAAGFPTCSAMSLRQEPLDFEVVNIFGLGMINLYYEEAIQHTI